MRRVQLGGMSEASAMGLLAEAPQQVAVGFGKVSGVMKPWTLLGAPKPDSARPYGTFDVLLPGAGQPWQLCGKT